MRSLSQSIVASCHCNATVAQDAAFQCYHDHLGLSLCHPMKALWEADDAAPLQERRTQLFSATMTTKVAKLQRACLSDPVKVEVATKYSTVDTLRQQYLFIPAKYKVR